MPSIRCSVTLLSDKSHTVDIEVRKEKKDFLWKVITASGGSLRLSANDGTWEVFGDNMLIFWYETTGKERKKLVPGYTKLPTLVIHLENDAFFDNIINNGKTIEDNEASLYNDNPSEKKVSGKLARMN